MHELNRPGGQTQAGRARDVQIIDAPLAPHQSKCRVILVGQQQVCNLMRQNAPEHGWEWARVSSQRQNTVIKDERRGVIGRGLGDSERSRTCLRQRLGKEPDNQVRWDRGQLATRGDSSRVAVDPLQFDLCRAKHPCGFAFRVLENRRGEARET